MSLSNVVLKSSTCFISCPIFSPVKSTSMLAKQRRVSGQLSTSAVLKHHFFPLNTSLSVRSVSHHSSRQQLHCMKSPIEQWTLLSLKEVGFVDFFLLSHTGGLGFSPKANHRKSDSLWYSSHEWVNPEVNEFDSNEPSKETLGWTAVHRLNHQGSLKSGVSQPSQLFREVHSSERTVSRLKENLFLCPSSCLSEIRKILMIEFLWRNSAEATMLWIRMKLLRGPA